MNTTFIGFYLAEVCELYSILPHELDEASLDLLRSDLDANCMAMFGKHAFIYDGLEVVG